MAIDQLQEKIRRLKTPIVLDFGISRKQLPPHLLQAEGDYVRAYMRFCSELLKHLQGKLPAVRFRFASFALMGPDGLRALEELTASAKHMGYYVILDAPESLCPRDAEEAAAVLMAPECPWTFDGLVVSSYMGSDGLRPFVRYLKKTDRDLFAVIRTGNKSAPELQDLLTGGRLVHMAAADIVCRMGQSLVGRCGYSRVAALAGVGAGERMRTLRGKYPAMFLLLDSYDYPNASAKKCGYAFDQLGHGAAVCAGSTITAAWVDAETDGYDYLDQAILAIERMKKNLSGYVTVL